ncbi:hypothetical protein N7530_005621 [Penicillium desertorum]|uniref:Uncharacterized protein n=1 Tax=Penicillium desertorum TaxID=1303715 RepID=A0A9X0BRV9_9EURO|nr:hypothetical protein N7530_005621 [Penicillium desertorum]
MSSSLILPPWSVWSISDTGSVGTCVRTFSLLERLSCAMHVLLDLSFSILLGTQIDIFRVPANQCLYLAMMKIAKAYYALVDGTFVGPALFVRPPLKVKSGFQLEGKGQGEATSVHPLLKLHAESCATG